MFWNTQIASSPWGKWNRRNLCPAEALWSWDYHQWGTGWSSSAEHSVDRTKKTGPTKTWLYSPALSPTAAQLSGLFLHVIKIKDPPIDWGFCTPCTWAHKHTFKWHKRISINVSKRSEGWKKRRKKGEDTCERLKDTSELPELVSGTTWTQAPNPHPPTFPALCSCSSQGG